MSIRLLIAEDHELVREGLRAVFSMTEVEIVAEAATGSEAVRLALEHELDVALVDLSMPNGDGFDVLRQVRIADQDLPILIYSNHSRPQQIRRCRELGASGYLVKGFDDGKLVESVRSVFDGKQIWHGEDAALTKEI